MSADHDFPMLDASTPIREAAAAILGARLKAVRRRIDQVRESSNPLDEEVHGLRVATRRASAAMSVFGPVVRRKDRRRAAKVLRRLRRSAAIARAADVHGAMILKMVASATGPRLAACGYALGRIASERSLGRLHARDTAVRVGSKRRHRLDDRLVSRLKGGRALGASTFGELAQVVLSDCFDRLELAMVGDFSSIERLHELRLAVKRFRYTLEVLEPCLEPSALDEALARSRALQQRLGDLNDLAELESRLERLAHELEDSDRAAEFSPVIAGLRVVQGELDRAMREKREAFLAWWTGSGGHAIMSSLRTGLLTLRADGPPLASEVGRNGSSEVRSPSPQPRIGEASAGGRP